MIYGGSEASESSLADKAWTPVNVWLAQPAEDCRW